MCCMSRGRGANPKAFKESRPVLKLCACNRLDHVQLTDASDRDTVCSSDTSWEHENLLSKI